jgi:hypothetical protein
MSAHQSVMKTINQSSIMYTAPREMTENNEEERKIKLSDKVVAYRRRHMAENRKLAAALTKKYLRMKKAAA